MRKARSTIVALVVSAAVVAVVHPAEAARDNTPPTVSITAPAADRTVAGLVTVSADATDNVGVVRVQFRLDGQPLGTALTAAPWSVTWDAGASPDGSYVLTAVARDAAGNTKTSRAVTVTVDNPPRIRRGVFSLTPAKAPVSAGVLASPLVTGVTIRSPWATVEATAGVRDWSYVDAELARAAAAGKQVALRITSGGRNTPAWVMTPDVQTFAFLDGNPYSPTYGTMIEIPVFWDPVFLERKKQLIAAAGQRFASHPNLILVSASCANALSDDWTVPHDTPEVEAWRAVGYTSAKLIDACAEIIDATMAAFPNQFVLMAIARNGDLDPDRDYVARNVASYGRSVYPGRFFVQRNSLAASTPDPTVTTRLGAWQPLLDSRPDVGGQMLWAVTDDSTCRMSGQITPCDPATTLQRAVQIGASYGMQYQEIYEQDLVNPALADVIRFAADVLAAPTAPTNLTATAPASRRIKLTWTASIDSVGVTGYRVFRNDVLVATPPTTAYLDGGLAPATTYTYRVTAIDAAGNESPPATATATTTKKWASGALLRPAPRVDEIAEAVAQDVDGQDGEHQEHAGREDGAGDGAMRDR